MEATYSKMRLFQSHTLLEAAIEPAPSFLRDPTREHLKTLVHYRDTKNRLPTPDKVAIMELSHSFEKRRLGKQQQILSEMNQRCREQEVSDMSSQLTAKCNISPSENRSKELTFYTTFMNKRQRTYVGAVDIPDPRSFSPTSSSQGIYEKTYKHFPARRVIKNTGKFDFVKSPVSFEKPISNRKDVSPVFLRKNNPAHASTDSLIKAKLMQTQRINGTVQMEHYTPRVDTLAPLVLPQIDNGYLTETHVDSFSASRVNLGSRTTTNPGPDTANTSSLTTTITKSTNKTTMRPPVKNVKLPDGGLKMEKSELHLTKGGSSPPPNSTEKNFESDVDQMS